jgi:type IV pilus assembly protein PilQ
MSMKNKQTMKLKKQLMTGVFLSAMQMAQAWADTAITDLNFSSLSGDKLQIQLSMNGPVSNPKVFQTDNPARIALDFDGVQSDLAKKMYPINQGAARGVYVAEVAGRTRVVVNLTEKVPYETKVIGDKVYVVLKPKNSVNSPTVVASNAATTIVTKSKSKPKPKKSHQVIRPNKNPALIAKGLLPEQTIKNIDFRRGANGEGRVVIALSKPNMIVDVKEVGGKVVLNFLNTHLPTNLTKNYDVSDFATPVHKFDAQQRGSKVALTIFPTNGNYDYSSYQSNGVLTVDFMPLTPSEKEALLKKKFPYSGKKLTFNFQDIEVRSVLQILADFTGLNIVAADSVDGNVSLRLNDVPWDQALDLILKSKGLAKRQAGNVVLVAPTEDIIRVEREELKAKKIVEQLEPLRTEYIQINYAKAEDIQALLIGENVIKSGSKSESGLGDSSSRGSLDNYGQNNVGQNGVYGEQIKLRGVLSLRGSAIVDGRTNTIVVKDTAEQLEIIAEMVKRLDVPVRQVMIEARIVTADSSFAREIGVKFGIAKAAQIGNKQSFAIGAGNNRTFSEIVPDASGSNLTVPDGPGYLVDLGASAIKGHPAGALAMTLARAADYVLNLELSALENDNRGEVLANPRVMTLDRETAYIKQGSEIPYSTVSDKGTRTIFKEALLKLEVTPQITPDGDVIMELMVKKDAPGVAGAINKKEVNTTVRVRDGETIVLGGVYEGNTTVETYKVPFLADLPGIGSLFKKKIDSERKRELLIFITPKVVKSTLATR